MRVENKISILLATYNGEKYINEQINSILNQTYTDWKLIIRDDGSTDGTVNIIKQYTEKYPDKMFLLEDSDKGLGASRNFGRLLENSDTDYMMFCDQDDVWLPEKVMVTYQKMKDLEKEKDDEVPILVHSDLRVVGQNLEILNNSFWRFQKLNPENSLHLNRTIIQNTVTGCTVMINKSLKMKATPVPEEAVMHDWWFALVALALGEVGYITEPTMLYRQHLSNEIGAKSWGFKLIFDKLSDFKQIKESLEKTVIQAGALLNLFDKDEIDVKELVYQYSHLNEMSFFKKRKFLNKNKIYKSGFLRNVGLFALI